MDPEERIQQLRKEVNYHLYRYHVLDSPSSATPNTTRCSRNWRRWSGSIQSW